MKKIISLLLSLTILLSITAGIDLSAYAEIIGGISGDYEYEYLYDDTIEIKSYNGNSSTISIPSKIDGHTVKKIGYSAFAECTAKSIVIPNTVTIIDGQAFFSCDSLTNISIPSSVKTIGNSTFYGCESLSRITLPDSIIKIGDEAFGSCTSLTDIKISNNLKYIGSSAFYNTGYYHNEDNWNNGALYLNNYLLDTKNIRGNFSVINGTKVIAGQAFYYSELTNVEIPNSVISIGNRAFYKCTNLKSIFIPNGVETIGEECFNYCENLNNITMSSTVISVGESAFENTAYYNNDENWNNHALYIGNVIIRVKDDIPAKIFNIKSNTVAIADYAFLECFSLTDINLPNSIVNIGNGSFYHCISLKNITIPTSVKNIGTEAFDFCENLISIDIPSSVNEIGSAAFVYCSSLTSVKISNRNCIIYDSKYTFPENTTIKSYGNSTAFKYAKKYSLKFVCIEHIYKNIVTKATTSKNGTIKYTCSACGYSKLSTIYYPKTISLSATSYTYDGKVKKPTVKVVGSNGKTISSSNYTVTYASGRKNVGKYAVKISFKGNYSGTKTLYFTIKPKATSISSVSAGSKKFTVKWKKQATQTTGYQIQYSTNSKFSKAKTVTVGKNSTTSKTISKLSAKKKYYVRVRTYKTVKINGKATKIYSSWSKAKAVTTKK
ncbi:MAG: fibronectin type III domain-containing protein [Eubacterium sp.]